MFQPRLALLCYTLQVNSKNLPHRAYSLNSEDNQMLRDEGVGRWLALFNRGGTEPEILRRCSATER